MNNQYGFYRSSLITEFQNEIKLIANHFDESSVLVEILDEEVYLFLEDKRLKKATEVSVDKLSHFFRKQNVLIRSEEKRDEIRNPILEEELFHWSNYVLLSKISSKHDHYVIIHFYEYDLLFISCEDQFVFSLINIEKIVEKKDIIIQLKRIGIASEHIDQNINYIMDILEKNGLEINLA